MNPHLTARIMSLAKEYFLLMSDTDAEHLSYDEYTCLLEYESKLNAYGNLLTAKKPATFLRHELNDAKAFLRCTRLRLSITARNGVGEE
jgi:hypothetical protein